MIYWHRAELPIMIAYPAVQLKASTMRCWLHAHSLTGHFMRWQRVWPHRDSSAAAACNMWPSFLPGSPLSIFHYSLFNLSPSCQTAVQLLTTFSSSQENVCLFVYPQTRLRVFNKKEIEFHFGWKMRLLSTPENLREVSWSMRSNIRQERQIPANVLEKQTPIRVWTVKICINQYVCPMHRQCASGFLSNKLSEP